MLVRIRPGLFVVIISFLFVALELLASPNLLKENSLRGYEIRRKLQQQKVWDFYCQPSLKLGFFSNKCLKRINRSEMYGYCKSVSENMVSTSILVGALNIELPEECREAILITLEKLEYLERHQSGRQFE